MQRTKRSANAIKMLEAAEFEFAEKGFESATMELIAARASVSKSHLYYHFDSKDYLLEELFAVRVGEILADKDELFAGEAMLDDALIERVLHEGVSSLLAAQPLFFRIAILELFRPGGRSDLVFGVLQGVTEDTLSRFRAYGLHPDPIELQSAVTWFALLPILTELLIGEERAHVLHLDPVKQHAAFESQLAQLYRAYLDQLRRAPLTKGGGDHASRG